MLCFLDVLVITMLYPFRYFNFVEWLLAVTSLSFVSKTILKDLIRLNLLSLFLVFLSYWIDDL